MTASAERLAGSFAVLAKADGEAGAPASRRPRAAFTLLEILLALALIGLLVGATVSISAHLLDSSGASPEDVFWQAFTSARKKAITLQQDVRLSFDGKQKAFVVTAGADNVQPFSVPGAGEKFAADFLPLQKTNSSVLIGGELMETETLPFVTLYADGTCSPFRVQFRGGGPASAIAIDPWTCAEELEVKND